MRAIMIKYMNYILGAFVGVKSKNIGCNYIRDENQIFKMRYACLMEKKVATHILNSKIWVIPREVFAKNRKLKFYRGRNIIFILHVKFATEISKYILHFLEGVCTDNE